jgi:DNA-binding NtrC family response regulator
MTHDRIGNILVVEDNTDAREAMTAFLEGEGYHAVGAANGEEALGYLRTSLIFCVSSSTSGHRSSTAGSSGRSASGTRPWHPFPW